MKNINSRIKCIFAVYEVIFMQGTPRYTDILKWLKSQDHVVIIS